MPANDKKRKNERSARKPGNRPGQTVNRTLNARAAGGQGNSNTRRGQNNKGGSNRKNRFRGLKIALLSLLVLLLIIGTGGLLLAYSYIKDAPRFTPGDLRPSLTSYFYDREGAELTSIYDEQNRIQIPLGAVPEHVQKAFVAIEDERYYDHYGVDPYAIARAFVINLRHRQWTDQGGSTITQQLVKNAFLTPEKTLQRKVQEAWLALQMERQYSKDEILEMYLNQIYFAHGSYGIEAAANTYLDKETGELTLAEAALLAGIPRSPNYYSPFNNPDIALQRQDLVLSKMHELGFISESELRSAKAEEIELASRPSREYPFPYFIDYVLHRELVDLLMELPEYDTREEAYEAIYNQGLKIHTTLDTANQAAVETVLEDESLYPENIRVDMEGMRALEDRYSSYPSEVMKEDGTPQPQSAAVVADPVSGEVLALVGGREYSEENQTLRYLSRRQPGSAIKPIAAYVPAMEENLITPGSTIDDSPFADGNWTPENFDRRFRGLVTVREALVHSLNVPAVKTFSRVTTTLGLDYAEKMGLSTIHPNDGLASTLGGMTDGVTAFDMAQAFSVLANDGSKSSLHTVRKIEDRDGSVLYERRSEPETVISPQTAYLTTDILKDVVNRGTASRLDAGRPVAAKTGTTDDNRDAYLVAYTPNRVVSFWMGHDIQKLGRISGGSGTTIPFMNRILNSILEDVPNEDFERPSGITSVNICNKSGMRPGEECPSDSIISELFPSDRVPEETCDMHVLVEVCSASDLLPSEYCPEDLIEEKPFLNRPSFEVTDERWRGGAGRGPADAGLMPPQEHCTEHSAPTEAPEGFTAYLLQDPLRAHLRWDERLGFETYVLYKKKEGEEFKLLQELPASETQFLDRNIEPGVTYTYRLVAVNKDGEEAEPAEWVMPIPDIRDDSRDSGEEERDDRDEEDEEGNGDPGSGGDEGSADASDGSGQTAESAVIPAAGDDDRKNRGRR